MDLLLKRLTNVSGQKFFCTLLVAYSDSLRATQERSFRFRKLQIKSHKLTKSVIENFRFCEVMYHRLMCLTSW